MSPRSTPPPRWRCRRGAFGDAAAVHAPVRQNFAQMRERLDPAVHADPLATLARVEASNEGQYAALAPVFAARLAEGRVRECHGDLHPGNLVALDGEPWHMDIDTTALTNIITLKVKM